MSVAAYFDAVYLRQERHWWRGENRYSTDPLDHSSSLITQATLRLLEGRKAGRALDLGTGEGADAIRLARLGYLVDAVDISSAATDKAQKFAAQEGVLSRVRFHTMDVAEFRPPREYDLVICNGLLHYVADKAPVLRRMRDATCTGGLNVISLWSTHSEVPDVHLRSGVLIACDDEGGIVEQQYRDWRKELLYYERNKIEAAHADLAPHRHSHIKLIARKP